MSGSFIGWGLPFTGEYWWNLPIYDCWEPWHLNGSDLHPQRVSTRLLLWVNLSCLVSGPWLLIDLVVLHGKELSSQLKGLNNAVSGLDTRHFLLPRPTTVTGAFLFPRPSPLESSAFVSRRRDNAQLSDYDPLPWPRVPRAAAAVRPPDRCYESGRDLLAGRKTFLKSLGPLARHERVKKYVWEKRMKHQDEVFKDSTTEWLLLQLQCSYDALSLEVHVHLKICEWVL